MTKIVKTLFASILVTGAMAQNVNIPDANFKAYLVGHTGINTNADTEIQVSEAASFAGILNCSSQNIADLTGIEAFTALTVCYCDNNQLTSVDLSANTNLTVLTLSGNNLSTIDLSNNTSLSILKIYDNQLTSLDVSQNTALTDLRCYNNQLTGLDVSQNTALNYLRCFGNSLTTLDVSSNTSLTLLNCENSQLTSLNVANGNNTNFVFFKAAGNTNLTCIQIDDTDTTGYNWSGSSFTFDAGVNFTDNCSACIVYIPDANFKSYLVGNTAINTNGDGVITCNEASAYTGGIDVSNLGITDLTGIEAFVNIVELNCRQNSLTSIDVSNNTNLTHLDCIINSIPNLDVSSNILLTTLKCSGNNLTSINVSNNTLLDTLYCDFNSISTLDLSQNTDLVLLGAFSNAGLTNIDLSTNVNLKEIGLSNTGITSLDVSNQPLLEELVLFNTSLTDLDLSGNPNLSYLRVDNANLQTLNIANGNNTIITTFNVTNNPNLTCIQVDDAAYSATNWTNIDSQSYFSETPCCFVNIPDANFKAALVANTAINTDADGEISCDEATAFTGSMDVSNLGITDMTGLEAFVNLYGLNCRQNSLTSIDVSANVNLVNFDCMINQITALDVSQNTALSNFKCSDNQLSALDVSQNTGLTIFFCNGNSISSIDVSNNPALIELFVHNNQLTSLDVSNNTQLVNLILSSNTGITSVDVSGNPNLTNLDFSNNNVTAVDVSNQAVLEQLKVQNNPIVDLDLSNNPNLTYLRANNANLQTLNVANGNNTNITTFNADSNPNLYCIQVDDATYSTTNWTNVDAQASFSTDCYCVYNPPANGNDVISACNSYTWIDGVTYTANNNTATYTLQSSAGCDSVVILDLTINVVDTSVTQSGSTLQANTTANSYQWVDCDNGNSPISGETGQSFTPSSNGNYAVEISQNGCMAYSSCYAINSAGMNERYEQTPFVVYPNPANSILNIDFSPINSALSSTSENFYIKIVNLLGETIIMQQINAGTNSIDISSLTNGIYFIESSSRTYKFVKE